MEKHENRIRAILTNTGGSWPLNDEDRSAIEWLHNHALYLSSQLYASNRNNHELISQIEEMRKAAEKASAEFMRIAVK